MIPSTVAGRPPGCSACQRSTDFLLAGLLPVHPRTGQIRSRLVTLGLDTRLRMGSTGAVIRPRRGRQQD
jgi:hypothetical protein